MGCEDDKGIRANYIYSERKNHDIDQGYQEDAVNGRIEA